MTPNIQRIGIFAIAIVMIVGTLGSFAVFILADKNQQTQQDLLTKQYQEQLEEQQKEAEELSKQYYPIFKDYQDRPSSFDADAVGESVTSVDLKQGDGSEITKDSTYRAYYIGWNPEGAVFDGSFEGDTLKSPLPVSPGSLIPGWYSGVEGMKTGGIREITLPSAQAYGEQGSGELIAPNTPIKFIVMIIPEVK